jgi:seryl-tRNA synthetase
MVPTIGGMLKKAKKTVKKAKKTTKKTVKKAKKTKKKVDKKIKKAKDLAVSFPNVSKTPTPAGPIPIPYPNISKISKAKKSAASKKGWATRRKNAKKN